MREIEYKYVYTERSQACKVRIEARKEVNRVGGFSLGGKKKRKEESVMP